jgi:hypothetical protein
LPRVALTYPIEFGNGDVRVAKAPGELPVILRPLGVDETDNEPLVLYAGIHTEPVAPVKPMGPVIPVRPVGPVSPVGPVIPVGLLNCDVPQTAFVTDWYVDVFGLITTSAYMDVSEPRRE